MRSKRVIFLTTALLLTLAYSWWSLLTVENRETGNRSIDFHSADNIDSARVVRPSTASSNAKLGPDSKLQTNTPAEVLTELKLPKQFVVRGISLKNEQTNEQAKTLLEYKGGLFEYVEKDYLLDTDMLLMKIKQKTVNIEYKGKIFTAELDDPNLLAVAEIEEEDFIELLSMTPEQIGARPRIIEHLVNLTATPYIADGMLIQPGLNPELFKSVGFQEDDVLKMINGKSVTLDEEFEMIKKELKTAQTLRFEVMRKGRLITLYLDIPSEALTITGG